MGDQWCLPQCAKVTARIFSEKKAFSLGTVTSVNIFRSPRDVSAGLGGGKCTGTGAAAGSGAPLPARADPARGKSPLSPRPPRRWGPLSEGPGDLLPADRTWPGCSVAARSARGLWARSGPAPPGRAAHRGGRGTPG